MLPHLNCHQIIRKGLGLTSMRFDNIKKTPPINIRIKYTLIMSNTPDVTYSERNLHTNPYAFHCLS